jgi:GMP synthase (glutamine-hydrolysing)
MIPVAAKYDTILILDFGSQYTHLIARRIREFGVYSELFACTTKISEIPFKPIGVILSGGPYSVYEKGSPHVDPAVWDLNVPVLGICYGLQEICHVLGGKVESCEKKEFGKAIINITEQSELFKGLEKEILVWMSHGDQVTIVPNEFKTIASTATAPYAAVENSARQIYGIQFHPEVTHSPKGKQILQNFVVNICGAKNSWTMVLNTNFSLAL